MPADSVSCAAYLPGLVRGTPEATESLQAHAPEDGAIRLSPTLHPQPPESTMAYGQGRTLCADLLSSTEDTDMPLGR